MGQRWWRGDPPWLFPRLFPPAWTQKVANATQGWQGGLGGHQREGLRPRNLEKEQRGCRANRTPTLPRQARIPWPVPIPKEGRLLPCHSGTPTSPQSLVAPPTHRARASGHSGGLRVRRGAGCFEDRGWDCAASSALGAAEPPPRRPLSSPPPCP